MEYHRRSAGKPPPAVKKKLPKDRVFGANAVELSEEAASRLVGGIVEKGISPPSSAPRPSVLPFPVARHRSHGPLWAPNVGRATATDSVGNDVDMDEEDNDPTNYEPLAEFAKPIMKKKKKGLDLSNWRGLVPSSHVSHIHNERKSFNSEVNVEQPKVCGETMRIAEDRSVGNGSSMAVNSNAGYPSVSTPTVSVDSSITEPVRTAALGLNTFSNLPSEANETFGVVNDHRGNVKGNSNAPTGRAAGSNVSLESQIDAENRALLDRMSPEEIAEAQEEIRNKISPGLLNMLKKRGLQKSEKQMNCGSGADGVLASDGTLSDRCVIEYEKESSGPESNVAPPVVTPSKQNAENRPDEGVIHNLASDDKNAWGSWSKRVEAVRDLRFSLDGNVIQEISLSKTCSADSAAERDFLRTEGDPGAAGYTVKEALALTRSVVPGQRTLALHLLACVLSKALHNICKGQLCCTTKYGNENSQLNCSASDENTTDWVAVWAYALGPEPEIALSVRMTLDDNHASVVLASAKVIHCILACDIYENFFNSIEKMVLKSPHTAPVFRSRPDIRHGFLGGGFWKYTAKPSNILPFDLDIMNGQNAEERTIQDDNIVAGQDVVAGLIRMGILSRLCYLLETDPALSLEECILSILIAIARHSPTSANAIWKCERLISTIVGRFTGKNSVEHQASKVKSVTLLRVLAQSSKSICIEFIRGGVFQTVTWQLYRITSSIEEWLRSGREACKLASELMIEQLRFWRVCIMYGCGISHFSGFFPSLCIWLNRPTLDKLVERDVFQEFASISSEAYLVLEALARRLPVLYSSGDTSHQIQGISPDHAQTWCWNDVSPLIDTALGWLDAVSDGTFSKFFQQSGVKSKSKYVNTWVPFLWILSSILHMFHSVLRKATPEDMLEQKGFSNDGKSLPEFVAKIVLRIIKSGMLNFSDKVEGEHCGIGSFVEMLCTLRHQSDSEVSLASIWCLCGLLRVITSIDHLVQMIKSSSGQVCFQGHELSKGFEILNDGILKSSFAQWRAVAYVLMKLVSSEWLFVHDIEVFGRGGPSPGVGVGWGASGGGFWSSTVTLAQADAVFLIELLETFHSSPTLNFHGPKENTFIARSVNSALASSLIAGPGVKMIIQEAIDMLLQIHVLTYLSRCIYDFPRCKPHLGPFRWEYTEADLMRFSKVLASHFTNRWLSVKKRKEKEKEKKAVEAKDHGSYIGNAGKKLGHSLDTIHEDAETSAVTSEDGNALTVEWARQRLPLPSHWVLCCISTIGDFTSNDKPSSVIGDPSFQGPPESAEVVEAGLFFLLGIEAISSEHLDGDISVVRSIPLIWKLHSLSVALLPGMGVLEEERNRDVFEELQGLYGQQIDELQFSSNIGDSCRAVSLRFQSEIHDSYPTFIETLVEQFAAISYGDLSYGRQIAIYLHRQIDASVRLATWNALSNARVLELLPPLGDCLSRPEGYLEPTEEDNAILEAYVKSWVSGSLDKAATRGSMTYTIALHHLSSFIFSKHDGEKLLIRKKLVKSLLRDYSRKQLHEGMMVDLIRYNYSSGGDNHELTADLLQTDMIDQRLKHLQEACDRNLQLLSMVEKLKSAITKHS